MQTPVLDREVDARVITSNPILPPQPFVLDYERVKTRIPNGAKPHSNNGKRKSDDDNDEPRYQTEDGIYVKPSEYLDAILYPDDNGEPLSDNTKQFEKIMRAAGNFMHMTADDPNIFVAGNLLWYPVKKKHQHDNPETAAPDVMIVFGRPKGYRGSYMQWNEDNIPPQIVFEIWSPSNYEPERKKKLKFYEKYGVEEYYAIDPDKGEVKGYLRKGDVLEEIPEMHGFRSPLLDFEIRVEDGDVTLWHPDGTPFSDISELLQENKEERTARLLAEHRAAVETRRAEGEARRAEEEARRAEEEARRAEEEARRAEEEARRAEEEARRAEEEARRAQDEANARAEAEQRAELEANARAEAERRAAEMEERIRQMEEQFRLLQEQNERPENGTTSSE
ncbi:MAG: Uma2 family endonuclease [Chloroflexota bacterium]